ncbi:MAG: hypothetical protein ACRENH_16035 [Gemmatimonadaceae bacterium]
MRARSLVAGVVVCLIATNPAGAQHRGVRGRIAELLSFGSCGEPLCLDNSVNATNGHGRHFIPDIIARNGAIVDFLADAIAANASNLPLSATGSGITFKFVGGLPVRTSTSLGPVFGERAQTLGRGRVVVGANMSSTAFSSLRGVPLDGLTLNFTHDDVAPAGLGQPLRENDILQVNLDIDVNLLVTTFFATWGVSDAVDIGFAVPIVHTGLTGRSVGRFIPFGIPTSHFFAGDSANPVLRATASTFGFATGVGDVALRMKATVRSTEGLAVAFMGDARLPTGKEDDLTGSGHFAVRGLFLASSRLGSVSPHVNLGYALRTGEGRSDALLATGGFDQPMSDWATVAVDVISEWQVGGGELRLPEEVRYDFPVVRTIVPTNIPNMKDHRAHASFGMKFRVLGGPIVVANALVPLRRGGLESRLLWTLGLDGNF